FCVTAIRDSTTNLITFTVYSKYTGWISIGTGGSMSGSTMFVGWKSADGGVLVSQRQGNGHNIPLYTKTPLYKVVPNPENISIPLDAAIAFSFTVPVSSNIVNLNGSSNFIFGVSNEGPTGNTSDPTISFPQHSLYSSFSMDLSKTDADVSSSLKSGKIIGGGGGGNSGNNAISLLFLHGLFMFIAWSVIPFVAVFIARYMKDRWGHRWYLAHKWLMLYGVGLFTVAGLLTVELNITPYDGLVRLIGGSNHGIIGTVVALIIYPLQILLGYVSNALWTAERTEIPWWDKVHWWLGRAVIILAIVNTYLGLVAYRVDVGWIVGYWVWIAAALIAFVVVGEYLLGGVVHHVKVDNDGKGGLNASWSKEELI
ncbi:hypothetical protein BDR26DRAFT_799019, partial [Obelidium mucronatum]